MQDIFSSINNSSPALDGRQCYDQRPQRTVQRRSVRYIEAVRNPPKSATRRTTLLCILTFKRALPRRGAAHLIHRKLPRAFIGSQIVRCMTGMIQKALNL